MQVYGLPWVGRRYTEEWSEIEHIRVVSLGFEPVILEMRTGAMSHCTMRPTKTIWK